MANEAVCNPSAIGGGETANKKPPNTEYAGDNSYYTPRA
jgi:hypothetical protein